MTATLVTYIGFVVAVVILMWAMIELSRRWYGHKKMQSRALHTWVPLNPTSVERDASEGSLSVSDNEEEDSQRTLRSRAQQNGHYSESKKTL